MSGRRASSFLGICLDADGPPPVADRPVAGMGLFKWRRWCLAWCAAMQKLGVSIHHASGCDRHGAANSCRCHENVWEPCKPPPHCIPSPRQGASSNILAPPSPAPFSQPPLLQASSNPLAVAPPTLQPLDAVSNSPSRCSVCGSRPSSREGSLQLASSWLLVHVASACRRRHGRDRGFPAA